MITRRYVCPYTNADASNVMLQLYLRRDFYNTVFKIEQSECSLHVSPLPDPATKKSRSPLWFITRRVCRSPSDLNVPPRDVAAVQGWSRLDRSIVGIKNQESNPGLLECCPAKRGSRVVEITHKSKINCLRICKQNHRPGSLFSRV
jgi:hypothetical protein